MVCLIHAFAPRWGIWLSNGFGAFKLVLLSLLVFTGFAALAGTMAVPKPNNFENFHGPTDEVVRRSAGGYALALLQVLYSYSGWENANYVGGSSFFFLFGGEGGCANGMVGLDRGSEPAQDAAAGGAHCDFGCHGALCAG